MEQPLISVIVPVYNVEKYIERCAKSLFKQTFENIEFIFVNDCTKDRSIIILQEVIASFPNRAHQVKIISHQCNQGLSAARNTGLDAARGMYIIACDADDYVEEVAYEMLYNRAIEFNADVVACAINIYDESLGTYTVHKFNTDILEKDSLKDLTKIEGGIYSALWNKLFRKSFLEDNYLRPNKSIVMWEDLYITFRARILADRIYVVDIPLYNYCQHENSIISSDISQRIKSQIECVKLLDVFCDEYCLKDTYGLQLAFLKLISKRSLFRLDGNMWISLFPEANKYILSLRHYFGMRNTIKFLMFGYGKRLGIVLFNLAVSLREFVGSLIK